jgi:amino acid transporter
VYTLAQIGLVRYFLRKGTFNPVWHLLVPVLAVAAIVYLYYKNVSPTPAYPNNWAIWIALIWAGLGIVGLIGLKVFRPGQLAQAATIIGEGDADAEAEPVPGVIPPRSEPSQTLSETQ